MVEGTKAKSLTDDIEKLFDLVKEGASYLLHFYLYFFSKTFPVEFIENLFDHHKENSSYDYSKDGKTYIYRLFSCIFDVEKQIVAIGLQYVYSYIPLPFVKNIYENFCVNNNLECTDVKLKKCKKALINSTKEKKKKQDNNKNGNEDDDLVSRPFPLIPQTPKSKTENTVSVPLSIPSNSRSSLQNANPKRSSKNSLRIDELSAPIKALYVSDSTDTNNSATTKNSSELSSLSQLDTSINYQKNILSDIDIPADLTTEQLRNSSQVHRHSSNPQVRKYPSSLSEGDAHVASITENHVSLPILHSIDTPSNAKSEIVTSSAPISSSSTRKPSKIPIKLSRTHVESLSAVPSRNIPNKRDSSTSPTLGNLLKIPNEKSPNGLLSNNSPPSFSIGFPREKNELFPPETGPTLPDPSKLNKTPVSMKRNEESTIQDLSKSNSGSPKIVSNTTVSSRPSTTTSTENNVKGKIDPFSDLAAIFNPSTASSRIDDSSLISNPFASIITPSDTNKPSSFLSNPNDIFSIPLNTSPSGTKFPMSQTVPSTLQSPNTNAKTKNDESVAPVSKKILPSIDAGNTLAKTIEQNNKAFEKNVEDFGKSIANVFSGANAPTPGPSARI